jgi:hypothetical protein
MIFGGLVAAQKPNLCVGGGGQNMFPAVNLRYPGGVCVLLWTYIGCIKGTEQVS